MYEASAADLRKCDLPDGDIPACHQRGILFIGDDALSLSFYVSRWEDEGRMCTFCVGESNVLELLVEVIRSYEEVCHCR